MFVVEKERDNSAGDDAGGKLKSGEFYCVLEQLLLSPDDELEENGIECTGCDHWHPSNDENVVLTGEC